MNSRVTDDYTVGRQPLDHRAPILAAVGLSKVFPGQGGGKIRAVDGVSLQLYEGETLGIVGESGSGKSTLARMLLGLENPTAGEAIYRGQSIVAPGVSMPRHLRREIQFVAQDPYSNLDPRMTIGRIISEGWRTHKNVIPKSEQNNEMLSLLDMVGIRGTDLLNRFPNEFSGGQRQRIAIARALALEPSVIILDEPVSSLDVSVQAQVLLLLEELQSTRNLSYVFIAHDLSVVEYFATRVAVMYRGRVVELGPAQSVFSQPHHPYTALLKQSIPRWQASGNATIDVPEFDDEPPGSEACGFYHRCGRRSDICKGTDPRSAWDSKATRQFACHHPLLHIKTTDEDSP